MNARGLTDPQLHALLTIAHLRPGAAVEMSLRLRASTLRVMVAKGWLGAPVVDGAWRWRDTTLTPAGAALVRELRRDALREVARHKIGHAGLGDQLERIRDAVPYARIADLISASLLEFAVRRWTRDGRHRLARPVRTFALTTAGEALLASEG